MKPFIKIALLYGVVLWVIPFLISFLVFPFKTIFPPFFETVMALTLAAIGVVFAILYFRKLTGDYLRQGMMVGLIWFAMSVLIDLPLFIFGGPMQMTFANYMMDIGLTYLIYPIVTIGFGWMLARK